MLETSRRTSYSPHPCNHVSYANLRTSHRGSGGIAHAAGGDSEVHNAHPTTPNGNDAGGLAKAVENVPKKTVGVPEAAAKVPKAVGEVPAAVVGAAAAVTVGDNPSVRRDVLDTIAAPVDVDVNVLHP